MYNKDLKNVMLLVVKTEQTKMVGLHQLVS